MASNGELNGKDHSIEALAQFQRDRFGALEHILEKGFDNMTDELRAIRTGLIEAVSGQSQVPLKAFILTQVIWAILCLLLLVSVTAVDLKLNWNEIHAIKQGKNDGSADSESDAK